MQAGGKLESGLGCISVVGGACDWSLVAEACKKAGRRAGGQGCRERGEWAGWLAGWQMGGRADRQAFRHGGERVVATTGHAQKVGRFSYL